MSTSAENPEFERGVSAPPAWRRVLRAVFQIGGFVIGIALLVWCVREAFSPENSEQLRTLRRASPSLVAALLALTALSIVLNGLVFWAVLRPVRRLRPVDLVAVNALATFLNYLPFKLSVLSRILIHNRRDGVPVFVIGSWFAAMGAVLIVGVGPLILATLITKQLGAVWLAIAGAGLAGAMFAVVVMARFFSGQRGLDRSIAIVDAFRMRPLSMLIRAGFVRDLHAGMEMLASPSAVALAVGLRLADTAAQAGRFAIAAHILNQPLGFDQALMYSVTYFAIGVLSPVGMLGFRESGTAGVAAFVGIADPRGFMIVPLLVGAAEAVVNLAGAGAAIAWLRPLRWLMPSRGPKSEPVPTSPA